MISNHEMNLLILGLKSEKIKCNNCRAFISCRGESLPLKKVCNDFLPERPICKEIGCRGVKGKYCRKIKCLLVADSFFMREPKIVRRL